MEMDKLNKANYLSRKICEIKEQIAYFQAPAGVATRDIVSLSTERGMLKLDELKHRLINELTEELHQAEKEFADL